MFSKATANFVHQIDHEGSLIHVSRLNDSPKLIPMALVVKRKRIWFWQKPKYQPTDFTLSDLLQGDEELIPGVSEADFVSYKGSYGDKISGKLDAEAGSVSLSMKGQGASKLQSCFGKLKKEELDVRKLLRDSDNRLVNMEHTLVQQLHKRADVLAVVKERIFTTTSCFITQTNKEQCNFQGVLGLVGMLGNTIKVCVKDRNSIELDSDVSLEIPSGTVIAYSINELEIKKNGKYGICLQPGTIGGFEADTALMPDDYLDMVDSRCIGSEKMDLFPLAELQQSTRCDFTKRLQETLKDRSALSCLQCVLEELSSGETLEEDSESPRTSVSALLDQLGPDEFAPLKAAHLLVSAMEELPDETLRLLSESSPDFVEAFDLLLCRLQDSSKPVSIQSLPALLQDNQTFQLAEQLLSSTGVTLKRDADRLWMETEHRARVLLFVLGLSIHGLSLLCSGL
ncbi:gasdermin-E-like isoform X2 [Acanthochromis polyacanthus]|uniref:Non-syndromic hearing impairment protein 5-like n=1 Tax=Acanthochromis polyacanthus TaxID=80966 RepID=A0A3Q1FHJ2_9TELE|nr:gasdermin-E-like isoform X2 [Acanthochromis polyacanthus]